MIKPCKTWQILPRVIQSPAWEIAHKRRSQPAQAPVGPSVESLGARHPCLATLLRANFRDSLDRPSHYKVQLPKILVSREWQFLWLRSLRTTEARSSGYLCGTLRNRDVARKPTWTYLRRSRKDIPMTVPHYCALSQGGSLYSCRVRGRRRRRRCSS
jgi:hypothetical protein